MAFSNSQNRFEPSTTKESIPWDKIRLGATAEDRGLFYVTAAGVYAGSYGSSYKAAATDILVTPYADAGALDLVYCLANAAIARGKVATFDTTDSGSVIVSGATTFAVGVALCDVADGEYAWFAHAGSCIADIDGVTTVGMLLDTAAAGEFTITGGTKADAQAVAEAPVTAGAALGRVKLFGGGI